MANIKFSQLPTTTSFTGATIPVVQGGTNYQVTAATIQSYVLGSGSGLSVSGNISGGNISVTGNIRGSYIIGNASQLTGYTNITATGNIQANLFTGNGAGLTNINAGNIIGNYGNANVAAYLPTYTGNIAAGNVSVVGNVQGTYILGNGSQLSGLPATYTNANVAAYLPTYTGNISAGNVSVTGSVLSSSVSVTGTVTANNVSAAGTVYLGQQYVEKTTSQTFSTSFTPTMSNGTVQQFTATNNFTLNAPTGMVAGQNISLVITQDATGNRAMTPNASYKFAGNIKTLSTTASSIDTMTIFYTGSTYLCTLVKGYV